MTKRREFPRAVRVEIVRRATRNGTVFCEGCGAPAKTWHVDHTIPDALYLDKSRPLTAADGKVLCAGSRDTCHGRKTAEQDVPTIAKAKRREAKHHRIRGAQTALAGRDRETRQAAAEARRQDRQGPGKLAVPRARALFTERV